MPTILIVLFIVALLPMVLAPVGAYFRVAQFGKFDNAHPRQQQAKLTGAGARTIAAHQNAWEALGVFTAVVLIAYVSPLQLTALATAAWVFLIARILHAIFYIANMPTLRSIAFIVGWGTCVYIFYLSATAY